MEQYIPKSALVAEIDRLIERAKAERVLYPKTILAAKNYLLIEDYKKLLSIIDTLDVKEVDLEHLEQEVKDFCYEYDDRKEKWYELCPNDRKLLYNPTWANFAMSIAKHFFELGISVNNKEHKGEKV